MIRHWWLTGAMALLLILATGAQAQRALDRDTVTRWIAAAEELQNWVEEQDEDFDDELFDGSGMPTFADIERAYRDLYNRESEVRASARNHGFRDADEWGNISARITMGLVHIEVSDHRPEMDEEMARAMRELDSNPDVPPQMREMMRQQIQQAMGTMDRMTEGVQEEDLPVLQEMRSELRAVIQMDEDDYDDW